MPAKIVNAPQKLMGTETDMGATKAAQDMILRIWQRHLDARRGELSRRMHALEGAERQQATHEFAQILLDQGKVKLGWAKACPILELHLQRLAEG